MTLCVFTCMGQKFLYLARPLPFMSGLPFAAGVRRKRPDIVKPLNQDQAHKLTFELFEDEEGDIYSDMEDGTSL